MVALAQHTTTAYILLDADVLEMKLATQQHAHAIAMVFNQTQYLDVPSTLRGHTFLLAHVGQTQGLVVFIIRHRKVISAYSEPMMELRVT